ncbi:MAG: thioredoxin-disulfide reductase [Candidatus Aenigmarchaeota archaeon]|nr:thioredoxin-disulfide reductase [Candidatus Aenigmarchaeota archaeon]
MPEQHDLIIIGGGPAGLAAALYSARGALKPLVIEGVSSEAGGQLMWTTDIENYPGFEAIAGPELIKKMRDHAKKFGASFVTENVVSVDFKKRPFTLKTESGKIYKAKSVIISTGAKSLMLGLKSETAFMGRGVSTCATCDAPFFRDKDVVVVGGGDTAMEDALSLAKFAKRVYVIHRRDQLRASKIMQDRAFANRKIEFIWNTAVEDILDMKLNKVVAVKLKDVNTGKVTEKKIDGVFVAIGHKPNTDLFKGQLDLDEKGYIKVNGVKTSVPGIYAAGDVADPVYKQAITSAGTGCAAALESEKFVESL